LGFEFPGLASTGLTNCAKTTTSTINNGKVLAILFFYPPLKIHFRKQHTLALHWTVAEGL